MCVVHRYTVERDDGQGSVFAPIDHPQLVEEAAPAAGMGGGENEAGDAAAGAADDEQAGGTRH